MKLHKDTEDVAALAPDPLPAPPRRRLTEAALIAAFERLLLRRGVDAIGVNALIQEAGVGKKQLYEHFGGLGGVALGWAEGQDGLVALAPHLGEPEAVFRARPLEARIAHAAAMLAEAVRARPGLAALLAAEFVAPPELRAAVALVLGKLWAEWRAILGPDAADDPRALIAAAAAAQLGLRAAAAPQFLGKDLASSAGWQAALTGLGTPAR